ncbi:hypothetical protein Egran_02507 [Elaphomyces granulatus]|uniref:Uncharacterized protein n=1 Tax=Elaphomyces granulatus TaxID=519963 RepID=A0A232LZZ1_9EURO|nr:hypothetical protein Egran_02507 [Elaphomyces granulatus]
MALKHLIPLFVLVVVVGILTFVGLAVYSIVQEVSTKAREKIEKKNISITKGGLKVGVKELRDEEYRDRSQNQCLEPQSVPYVQRPTLEFLVGAFFFGSSEYGKA